MADDFSTLESIFQMMEPSDLFGAKKLALGKKGDEVNVTKAVLDTLYNAGGSGALTIDKMVETLNKNLKKAKNGEDATFKEVFHCFTSSEKQPDVVNDNKNKSFGRDGKKVIAKTSFKEIVGSKVDLKASQKTMGIFTLTSPYISPAIRNAERCEMFLNNVPSIHASRMTPILGVEFAFNRVSDDSLSAGTTFGQLRFLMGGSKIEDKKSPNAIMLAGRTAEDKKKGVFTTTAGMEMFTSPQTLVNPSPVDTVGRYADVLDPFRPFASIESFTVNVTPTVGLYSYKKATLVFKLHDRSRLTEIADLIRPQIFQNAKTAPTVWMTYGWRYPYEPQDGAAVAGSRSYSDFINNNMLVREAYAVANSQFSFDQVGQVTVTLELWTKGASEMRTIRIDDANDKVGSVKRDIEEAAKRITQYATALNLTGRESTSVEVRPFQIIESAERGAFPDMSSKEITDALNALQASFKKGTIDDKAANALIKELKDFYTGKDKKNLDFKKQLAAMATQVALDKFKELEMGADPFLPHSDNPNPKRKDQTLEGTCASYNKQLGTSEVKDFKRSLCSFGKLFSVFSAHALEQNGSIDEMQVFFHQFNDHAGLIAGYNIAEFPIEMQVFFDQYRKTIEAKGTESLTLEEFLKLVIDAQLSDERNLAYGFKTFFEQYKPGDPPNLKKGDANKLAYENALAGAAGKLGPFTKPQIEVYLETTFATDGEGKDLLRRFEMQETGAGKPEPKRAEHLTRIMRVHVFDKANNPYKTQSLMLRSDNDTGAQFREVEGRKEEIDAGLLKLKELGVMKYEGGALKHDPKDIKGSYASIKRQVSKTMPSIIYGSNATMVINANLASKMDPLMAVAQMQTVAKKAGKPSVGEPNGSGTGGLPLRIIPAAMTLNTMGCPTLAYGQVYFVDFNTGTTVDNIYVCTGITHTMSPGKFESQMTLGFSDGYARYEGAQSFVNYVKGLKVPEPKKK